MYLKKINIIKKNTMINNVSKVSDVTTSKCYKQQILPCSFDGIISIRRC